MNVSALLTSAGINIAISVVLLSLYSILRKQPGNVGVYFGRRLAQEHTRRLDPYWLDRFVPSPSWIAKAWSTSEEEILQIGGLDAVAFLRILVFSIRIFSIAAIICMFLVLPLNYYGQQMIHKQIPSESLDVFTITNVEEGSKWLWAHCLALYIISFSACILLYFEYKSIARMRLAHIAKSPPNPSHFSVLVRAIPWTAEESYSDAVRNFFTNYHASSYLSHQMVYRSGTVQKLMSDAEKVYKRLSHFASTSLDQTCQPSLVRCGLCGGTANSFKMLSESDSSEHVENKPDLGHFDSTMIQKECGAAFVFFKTRYAAVVASQVLQSSNPMLWVTDLAPEPHDVYWSNLCIPYKQLWIRKIVTLLAATVLMFLFLIPVTFVQGLSQLEQLQQLLPFLKGILKKKYISQLVTGYLPSVVLMLFLYIVPPVMMLFSAVEGSISRSGRKKSACKKILYFTIWNVFFVNVFSGSVISQLDVISSPKDIPTQLAKAVPRQATFFITYVLTSGWASLSSEIMQPFALLCNLFNRFKHKSRDISPDCAMSFPYQTEVPKVLLFGLLGFTCAILEPLILPFLLVYFFLGYIVYRNQFLNVYISKYESRGEIWPIVHNTTIFSLVLSQVIALGVFGLKKSPIASGFTIPLVILTLLFNEYCRQRFHPIFKNFAAQDLIDMDRRDEQCGRMEEIHQQLKSAYCQFSFSHKIVKAEGSNHSHMSDEREVKPGLASYPTLGRLHLDGMQQVVTWLSMLTFQERRGQHQPKPTGEESVVGESVDSNVI
ncbi:protein of unknown function DUF221 [Macleaya cordata]|uniref:CSC1-like protein RXW8 n=1 Tax=Macleaya cordata TaxID=56857 RepID=A0A200QVR6_MACCD|nr:protein of unknown function DUF221 [Macleaya cordata]